MFRTNLPQVYKKLYETGKEENISPDPDEATKVWSDICSVPSFHKQGHRQLQRAKQELADVKKPGVLRSWLKASKNVFQVC